VHAPRVASKEIEIASETEIKAVLQYLCARNRPLYAIATLALATGARRGELCALKWKDFDPDSGLLRIERSLETTKAGLRVKSPKTRHGRRTISIPASVADELRAHWKAQQEQRLSLGLGRSGPEDLIFATPEGGAHASPTRSPMTGCALPWPLGGGSICTACDTTMPRA